MNITVQLFNDGIHDTKLNVTFETFFVIQKLVATLKVKIPENGDDQNYQREIFKTSVDVGKFFQGVQGSLLMKILYEGYQKSINRPFIIPLPKVKTLWCFKFLF